MPEEKCLYQQPMSDQAMTEGWKWKRSTPFFMAVLHTLSIGFTITIILTSLVTYLHDIFHLENVDLYYGRRCGGLFLIILVCCLPISSWFDDNRRLKIFLIGLTVLCVIQLIGLPSPPLG